MNNNYLCKRYHVAIFLGFLFLFLILVADQIMNPFLALVSVVAICFVIQADVQLIKHIEQVEARGKAKVQRVNIKV